MKIQGKGKEKVQETDTRSPAAPDNKPAPDKQKAFSDKLRKVELRQTKPDEPAVPLPPQSGAMPMLQPYREPDPVPAGPMTSTASVLPPALRDLVGEIHVHAGGAGPTEIEIQFTSQTLEGLRVNIKREEGVVSIQFSTSSESTSRLLAQHMPQLSKTLTSRDIPAVISIRGARDSSLERRSGEAGGRSRKRQ